MKLRSDSWVWGVSKREHFRLTKAQSRSTASRMSSWWPIRDTPKSSSSWWVIRRSWSPPTFSLSKFLMYCCRQSSRPGAKTHKRQVHNSFLSLKWCIRQSITFKPQLRKVVWDNLQSHDCVGSVSAAIFDWQLLNNINTHISPIISWPVSFLSAPCPVKAAEMLITQKVYLSCHPLVSNPPLVWDRI